MSRISFIVAASLVAVVGLAACGASSVAPSASPSVPTAAPTDTPQPIDIPTPSVSPPPATPEPTEPPDTESPRPTAEGFSPTEQSLLDGVQRGTKNCQPVRGSDLPEDASGGIECDSTDAGIARIGFYMFASNEDMLSVYISRMEAEGVEIESGTCNDGEAEHAYVPDEAFANDRAGCFLNDEGLANYRYTITGDHVYVGILGRTADMAALEDFAWKGSMDTPGMPTLWFGGID